MRMHFVYCKPKAFEFAASAFRSTDWYVIRGFDPETRVDRGAIMFESPTMLHAHLKRLQLVQFEKDPRSVDTELIEVWGPPDAPWPFAELLEPAAYAPTFSKRVFL